jgi:hypothetical protein
MAGWLSHSPSDFLMFGPEVYWRLFELQNRALWPLPAIAATTGLAFLLLLAVRRRRAVRPVWLVTALAWAGAAYFLATRYAPINSPIDYAVWAFGAEAVLITLAVASGALAIPSAGMRAPDLLGFGLLAYAVILHPLVGPGFGRPLAQAEVFGVAPDPTALASLGLLGMTGRSRCRIALSVVPVAWCALSAATLLTLGSSQGWILIAALGLWTVGRAAEATRRGSRRE